MKTFLAAFILLFSVLSSANTVQSVFQANSPIPQDLKVLILQSVTKQCGSYFSEYGLGELQTEVQVVKLDQFKDTYFTTVFSTAFIDNDGYHPSGSEIIVKSADLDINNPISARYQIFEITVNGHSCRYY